MLLAGVNVPNKLKKRWSKRLKETQDLVFPKEWRLLNHFSLGADPEFIFTDKIGKYIHAQTCDLNTLAAFGCDMAGRQAELRAYPSRSALEVVASLIETLRWMNACVPVGKLNWIGCPNWERDGCAGHIHFGRQSNKRAAEIKALDKITKLLINSGLWMNSDIEGRGQAGYGKYGDYRVQSYGYEYRTTPTWMASPWFAYFVIVVSKLALLHGDIFVKGDSLQQIKNLIAAYKGKDDDAALVDKALRVHGFPVYFNDDFKARWGVSAISEYRIDYKRHHIPTVIKPAKETVKQLFDFLNAGYIIPKQDPQLTWDFFALPNGIDKVFVQPHKPGIMDIGRGLICNFPVEIRSGEHRNFRIYTAMALNERKIKEEFRKRVTRCNTIPTFHFHNPKPQSILLYMPSSVVFQGQNHATNTLLCQELKDFISDPTLFPICKAEEYKENIFAK